MNRKMLLERIQINQKSIEVLEETKLNAISRLNELENESNLLNIIKNQKDELTKQQKKIDELKEKSSFDFYEIKRLEKENEELKEKLKGKIVIENPFKEMSKQIEEVSKNIMKINKKEVE